MTHTPSTRQVRDAYVRSEAARDKARNRYEPGDDQMYVTEFDAWRAQAASEIRASIADELGQHLGDLATIINPPPSNDPVDSNHVDSSQVASSQVVSTQVIGVLSDFIASLRRDPIREGVCVRCGETVSMLRQLDDEWTQSRHCSHSLHGPLPIR
ncbi:hypothetical protein GCG21_08750 [Pseudactinotalea sp. HY160]|uniref:hypothetical protein n=1 Tax=Pseudactinotalea sp. HY160 TaxID=2654490 RepID=UPI00128B3D97|nr:hypothetical protein [Pseudactinotalea sp. HY160]MPV50093.1 hypothetical protein [Pseudactinotalea sp. HY160]